MYQKQAPELPRMQQAINELQGEDNTPEDQRTLDEWQAELNEARGDIGKGAVLLAELNNGLVVPKLEVQRWQAEGQNPNEGTYNGNQR